ncbi:hypothetical protein [Rhodococcus qingshengii]|uniref:hypothetical protein n=1 Tax=Rhodococcus qingshengii TaxID=334542 RepID=UPI0011610E47|nr:hypothetical protein [Rhodococcus qingshengii]MCZ4544943.1 hypothetical protein [Rhodococcus qingshengii]
MSEVWPIKIEQPIAIPGDHVVVSNYRTKDGRWENGVCRRAEYHLKEDGSGSWSYTVLLDRRTPQRADKWNPRGVRGGNVIILHVGGDFVEMEKEAF